MSYRGRRRRLGRDQSGAGDDGGGFTTIGLATGRESYRVERRCAERLYQRRLNLPPGGGLGSDTGAFSGAADTARRPPTFEGSGHMQENLSG